METAFLAGIRACLKKIGGIAVHHSFVLEINAGNGFIAAAVNESDHLLTRHINALTHDLAHSGSKSSTAGSSEPNFGFSLVYSFCICGTAGKAAAAAVGTRH